MIAAESVERHTISHYGWNFGLWMKVKKHTSVTSKHSLKRILLPKLGGLITCLTRLSKTENLLLTFDPYPMYQSVINSYTGHGLPVYKFFENASITLWDILLMKTTRQTDWWTDKQMWMKRWHHALVEVSYKFCTHHLCKKTEEHDNVCVSVCTGW